MESRSWAVPPTTKLKWRRWRDELVVFNPASGDTHYLNAVAGAVLAQFERGPATLDDILRAVEARADEPLDSETATEIRELVERLDSVGLIETVRS